jgi:TonB family protein
MSRDRRERSSNRLRRAGARLLQVLVLALMVALALPGGAEEGRAIKSRVAPVYPELAKRMKVVGSVRLEATVNAEGKVTDVKTVSGNHMLSTAAEDAVRQWKFVPGTGQATVQVEVNFGTGQ